jgi:hypothetical protein
MAGTTIELHTVTCDCHGPHGIMMIRMGQLQDPIVPPGSTQKVYCV